jgi:hypothetical protein
MLTFFDAKRELKQIYALGLKAIKRKDAKYINYLLFNLEQLDKALIDKFKLDQFGRYVIGKEIKKMRAYLSQKR